jgi:AraC-like DNA-binding protein
MRPSPYISALRVPVPLADMAASPERCSVLAKEIKDYILPNLHYRDDRLGIDALAKRFLKSPSTLKKIFRSDFRIPIHVFIVRQRMQLALNLLREKELSISEIAFRVGYEELSNFSRDFKTHFGYSPRVFQKR